MSDGCKLLDLFVIFSLFDRKLILILLLLCFELIKLHISYTKILSVISRDRIDMHFFLKFLNYKLIWLSSRQRKLPVRYYLYNNYHIWPTCILFIINMYVYDRLEFTSSDVDYSRYIGIKYYSEYRNNGVICLQRTICSVI